MKWLRHPYVYLGVGMFMVFCGWKWLTLWMDIESFNWCCGACVSFNVLVFASMEIIFPDSECAGKQNREAEKQAMLQSKSK